MSDGSGPSIPPSESGAQDELVDKEVVIQGIKNKKRTDLNGKRARVDDADDEESHAQHAPMDEEDDDGTEEGDATDNDEPQDASGGGDPVPPPAAAATELEMAADERGASAAAELGEEASAEASDGYEAQLQRLLQERPPQMDKADVDWVFEKTPAECVDALENINEQIKVEEDPVDLARYRYFARVCEFRASRRESVVVGTEVQSETEDEEAVPQHTMRLTELADELIALILGHCDATSLARCCCTAKYLREAEQLHRSRIWEQLVLARWPASAAQGSLPEKLALGWRAQYRMLEDQEMRRKRKPSYGNTCGTSSQTDPPCPATLTLHEINQQFEFFLESNNGSHSSAARMEAIRVDEIGEPTDYDAPFAADIMEIMWAHGNDLMDDVMEMEDTSVETSSGIVAFVSHQDPLTVDGPIELLVRRRNDGALANFLELSGHPANGPEGSGDEDWANRYKDRVTFLGMYVTLDGAVKNEPPNLNEGFVGSLSEACIVIPWHEEDWPDEADIPEPRAIEEWNQFMLIMGYTICACEIEEEMKGPTFTLKDLSRILTSKLQWDVYEE